MTAVEAVGSAPTQPVTGADPAPAVRGGCCEVLLLIYQNPACAVSGARSAPPPGEWANRLQVVLHVLHLLFNEGYAVTSGPEASRPEFTAEAIRLTRTADQEPAAASSGSPRSSSRMAAALRPGPAETDPPGWVVAPVW